MSSRRPGSFPLFEDEDAKPSGALLPLYNAGPHKPAFDYPSPMRTPPRSRVPEMVQLPSGNKPFLSSNLAFTTPPPTTPRRVSQTASRPLGVFHANRAATAMGLNQETRGPRVRGKVEIETTPAPVVNLGGGKSFNFKFQVPTPPATPEKQQDTRSYVDSPIATFKNIYPSLSEEHVSPFVNISSPPSTPLKSKTSRVYGSTQSAQPAPADGKRLASVEFEPTAYAYPEAFKTFSQLLTPPVTPLKPKVAQASVSQQADVKPSANVNDEPGIPEQDIFATLKRQSNANTVVNLAQIINRRSTSTRPTGLCEQDPHPNWADDIADRPPEFFYKLPRQLPALAAWASVGIFANGQTLKYYQALDLQRMINREKGEKVCGTDVVNSIGYLLGYDMGFGKTVTTLALILCNPPPKDFPGAKATLVVVPNKGIISHWYSEAKKFAQQLDVCRYDSISAPLYPNADIVLVTYNQLVRQLALFLDPKTKHLAVLFALLWYRAVLDEAHKSRNPETKTAQSIWALRKQHGLCLTGTPAQNTLLDYYSILRFLGVTCQGVDDLATFQRKICSKRQKGPINRAARKLLDTIKDDFCIIRKKFDPETGKALVKLPKRTDITVEVTLTHQERGVYETVKVLRLTIFAKIMRRRQACDHPLLIAQLLDTEPADTEDYDEEEPDSKQMKIEEVSAPPIVVERWPKKMQGLFKSTYLSSKLVAMQTILKKVKLGQKTIIFTHFTSMLPAIQRALLQLNICWAEYTGDMTTVQREDALEKIAKDDDCTVIIVSIMAGGCGLNIISCNTVILLEPWWNPYAEEQAIARAHRIGQERPVHVYRLVVKDTIEESIVKTQASKRQMMGDDNPAVEIDDATKTTWLAGP